MNLHDSYPDRKRPAHQPIRDRPNASRIIFLTVCTDKRQSILDRNAVHELLKTCWTQADSWLTGRYLLMPDHIHLFCSPVGINYPPLLKWVNYWKSLSARSWPNRTERKVWQRDFWDTQLRRGDSYTEKWRYVVNNPVRAGLVEESSQWPYQGQLNEFVWHA
ncbi:MAG TPA: transposase [Pontiella sp.]|nr:transposase [Pontiella sp.]